jgi:hypothetical protein
MRFDLVAKAQLGCDNRGEHKFSGWRIKDLVFVFKTTLFKNLPKKDLSKNSLTNHSSSWTSDCKLYSLSVVVVVDLKSVQI